MVPPPPSAGRAALLARREVIIAPVAVPVRAPRLLGRLEQAAEGGVGVPALGRELNFTTAVHRRPKSAEHPGGKRNSPAASAVWTRQPKPTSKPNTKTEMWLVMGLQAEYTRRKGAKK
jgi:hypothetical protein